MSWKVKCQCDKDHRVKDNNELGIENPHCGQQQKHQSWTNVDFEFVTAEQMCADASIVTFVFDDSQKVEVVKQFLCHWSPVFNAMLSTKEASQKSSENEINLPGKSAKPFELLVYFCYTGKLTSETYETDEMVDLFVYANEYQITKLVDKLKPMLVVSFPSNLSLLTALLLILIKCRTKCVSIQF